MSQKLNYPAVPELDYSYLQWQEMTSSDSEGNQHRMLMVCQIRTPHQNNWMRSQYIPVQNAQRLYVEIEFTIR